MLPTAYNREDFRRDFATDQDCLLYILKERFPNGCPCGMGKLYRITGRRGFACSRCGKHIYPLSGTAFEKTTGPLRLWFYALFLISRSKAVLTPSELQQALRVSYKTAARMRKRLYGKELLKEKLKRGRKSKFDLLARR